MLSSQSEPRGDKIDKLDLDEYRGMFRQRLIGAGLSDACCS